MPGIISAFSFSGAESQTKETIELVSASMFKGIGQENHDYLSIMDGKLSVVVRCGTNDNYGYLEQNDKGLFWFGNPVYEGNFLTKESLSGTIPSSFDELVTWSSKLTGHFQLVSFDSSEQSFAIVTDRVSSLPFYETAFGNTVVVTPEVLSFRGLRQVGWKPKRRKEALYEMLSVCHLLGDSTYWHDVSKLGPAAIVAWNNSGKKKITSYYRFPADEAPHKSQSAWIKQLNESIQKDIDELPGGRHCLTLSGGFDSRALLAILHEKQVPFETVSYSFGDKFTHGFDLEVAEYFAKKIGAKHLTYRAEPTDSDTLIDNIKECLIATGGENDAVINQYGFLGKGFFEWLVDRNDVLLRGDEVWGWGDRVASEGMAFWRTSLFSFRHFPMISTLLNKESYDQGLRWHDSWRQSFLEDLGGQVQSFNDLKDYLYWRIREPRVIQNMAYYARCNIVHQAPFVYGHAMAVCGNLPARLRENKYLFRRAMEKYYPALFLDKTSPTKAQARQSARSIAVKQPRFEAFVRDLLIDNPPEIIDELFRRDAIEALLHNIVNEKPNVPKEKTRYNVSRFAYDILRKNQWAMSQAMAKLEKAGKATFPLQADIMLFRLITMALAAREYE